MALRPDETWYRLRDWTYGQTASERLAAQAIQFEGYRSVDPSHPLGGKDGGKDALAKKDGLKWIMAVYFPRGEKAFNEVAKKFTDDLKGVAKNEANGMVFVTNQELTLGHRKQLKDLAEAKIQIDLIHLERLVAILDAPEMHSIRAQYLFIETARGSSDKQAKNRLPYLKALREQRHAQRLRRLRAAGLVQEQCEEVIQFIESSYDNKQQQDIDEGSLNLFVADAGSGKTEWTTQWILTCIERAYADPHAPLPIWLHARSAKAGFAEALQAATRGLDIPASGLSMVLDGLDEVEPRIASNLLEDAEATCFQYPGTTIVATSRRDPFLEEFKPKELYCLNENESLELVQLAAGQEIPYHYYSLEMRESLSRPLLAIAVGVLIANSKDMPKSTVDLISQIPSIVIKASKVPETASLTHTLARIAIHTIEHEEGFPTTELRSEDYQAVVETPLVVKDKNRIAFNLPIHEQYYGALALKSGLVDVSDVAQASKFGRWRYSIALGIANSKPRQADRLFTELATENAGSASWILQEISPRHGAFSSNATPTFREMWSLSGPMNEIKTRHPITTQCMDDGDSARSEQTGRLLRDSYLSWLEGFGGLGQVLSSTSGSHPPLPTWGILLDSEMSCLLEGYRHYNSDIMAYSPPIKNHKNMLSLENNTNEPGAVAWARLNQRGLPGGSLARWSWSQTLIKEKLASLIRASGLLSTPGEIIYQEKLWVLARNLGVFMHQAPDTQSGYSSHWLVETINNMVEKHASPGKVQFKGSKSDFYLDDIVYLREEILRQNLSEVYNPTPAPDLPRGDWIWSGYSRDRVLEYSRHLLENTSAAYADLIGCNFSKFGKSLSGYNYLPMKIRAYVSMNDEAEERMALGPTITFSKMRAEPAFMGHSIEVSLTSPADEPWQLLAIHERSSDDDSLVYGESYSRQSSGLPFGSETPVTDWAYSWLLNDLQDLGWGDSLWRRGY